MYHRSQFPSASAELLPARGTFKEELQLEEASAYLWLPSIELILKEPPFSQKETEDKVNIEFSLGILSDQEQR